MAEATHDQSTVTVDTAGRARRPTGRLERGAVVGRYVVLDFIDRGGMGVVYKAYDPELERPVALKLVAAARAADPAVAASQRARLLREAQALAQLAHPNVVTVHDVGPHGDGIFVAMEYVDGQSLKAYLAEGPHPRAEVLAVLVAAGHGLAAAHRAGIVHRDVKPGNVLLGADGRVRVIDFGLARATHESAIEPPAGAEAASHLTSPLTGTGKLVGTPRYMAPEQHAGGQTSERTDQFGFCLVAFHSLYGRHAFAGADREAIVAAMHAGALDRPAGHDVPAWIDRVLVRGLAAEPADRYPSMDALLADLTADPALARAQARARRWRLGLVGLALGSAVLAAWAVTRPRAASAPVCQDGAARLAGVWDPRVQATIRDRFATVAHPYAQDTFPRVARVLDAHAAAWRDAHRDACLATHVRREQSAALLDLRMQCLERRLGQLRALTRLLAAADAEVVDRAVQAAATLDAVGTCADATVLASRVAPPGPAQGAPVGELRQRLAGAEALYLAGRYQDARAALAELRAQATAIGYAPVQGEVAELTSQVEWRLGQPAAALAAGYDAAAAAQASGDDPLLVKAYGDVMVVLGVDLERLPDAEVFARFAEATLGRLGDGGELRFRWLHRAGILYLGNGDPRAKGYLDQAYALGVGLYGREHPEVARVLSNLGVHAQQQGDVTGARAAFTGAYEIFERTLGPAHPTVGAAHTNLGVAAWLAHDHATARAEYAAGLRILEATLGPEHPRVATTLANLGEVALAQRDLDAAAGYYQRALAIAERALGPADPGVAEALVGLGAVRLAQGRAADAIAACERALAACGADRCAGEFARVVTDARATIVAARAAR